MLVRRHLDDPLREGGLSVLTPFMAFLLAELVHVSGVVAVVVAGLVLTYAGPRVIGARSRTQAFAFWDLATFLLNGGLFVLVGLQFHRAAENLDSTSLADALMISLAITGVVIVTRLVWVHLAAFVIRTVDRRAVQRTRRVSWRQRTALGWAGFRGAVSLATALAVPMTVVRRRGLPGPRPARVHRRRWSSCSRSSCRARPCPRWSGGPGCPRTPGASRSCTSPAPARRRPGSPRCRRSPPSSGSPARSWTGSGPTTRTRSTTSSTTPPTTPRPATANGACASPSSTTSGRAVTALRDANEIDDIVLRELQAVMDAEEVRLLGPVPTD